MERVWTFKVGRFLVALDIEEEEGYEYDGDDDDGEIQRAINRGSMIAFESRVRVYFRGSPIGEDNLGGSVYYADKVSEFWTAHRGPDPEHRNTLAMKARNTSIGHYFPDMVRVAVKEARDFIKELCPPRGC